MHIEFIARLCTEQGPLMNSDLVFEGQGHSRHPHSRGASAISLPCDPYCGRPTAVGSLPPRKTCTDQFLSICGQTLKRAKVVRTCLAGQPAIVPRPDRLAPDPLSSSCVRASASFGSRDPLETRASVGDSLKSV